MLHIDSNPAAQRINHRHGNRPARSGYCYVLACLLGSTLLALPGSACAHVEAALSPDNLWSSWSRDWWVLMPLLLAGGLYTLGIIRLWRHAHAGAGVRLWEMLAFALGWLVAFIALISPLDALGSALFSAHMVQHELLMLVSAPLLVVGKPIPVWLWALPAVWRRHAGALAKLRAVALFWHACTRPFAAWSIHALVLWVWHIPLLFEAAVGDTLLHTFQHIGFMFSALLFWWVMFDRRHGVPNAALGMLYIFTTAVHTSVLGALLTFSTHIWYPIYARTTHVWGLGPLEDQQLGGLIMWVPGGVVYLAFTLVLLLRALQDLERRNRQRCT